MARKIFSWTLIILSEIALLLSVAGIGAAWIFNEPLKRESLGRLNEIDTELQQGQATLKNAQLELEQSLRVLDASEQALNQFTQDDPKAFFENVRTTLDDELIPELETAKERLITARDTLENLRLIVFGINVAPFVSVNVSDEMLTDLIDSADSLQVQIKDVGELAEQASTLLSDATDLLGGDFSGTRESLEGFLADVKAYQQKVTGWRTQVTNLKENLPIWINSASIVLTFFLLWFGLSQFSLLLHGLSLLRGENPLEVLRRNG